MALPTPPDVGLRCFAADAPLDEFFAPGHTSSVPLSASLVRLMESLARAPRMVASGGLATERKISPTTT